jgi:hypothetical protein
MRSIIEALHDTPRPADADRTPESGASGTPTLFINGRRQLTGDDGATLGAALAASKER